MEGPALPSSSSSSVPTSRIIIKNLPKWISEDRIRKHFEAKGHVTDVKFMYTHSGVFRRFAYLGYSNLNEASAAVQYFDRTFVDTCRIQVEFAQPIGSESLTRPWSKYSEGSSAHREYLQKKKENIAAAQAMKDNKETKVQVENQVGDRKRRILASILGEETDENAPLRSFISQKETKKLVWENDADEISVSEGKKKKKKKRAVELKVERATIVPNDQDDGLSSSTSCEQQDLQLSSVNAEKYHLNDNKDDVHLLREDGEEYNINDDPEPNADMIAETGRLFIRNLSYSCTEEELRKLFEPFGPLSEVHLSISKETRKSKGFAYVLFMFPEHALQAYTRLDGAIFLGRILHILPAQEKPSSTEKPSTEGATTTYRDNKEQEQKASATSDYNWNSLFLRSDTVIDAIAAKLGVPKASLVDVKSENLATKLAVAETNLIQETKAYLEAEGVVLDAFGTRQCERSDRVLLVKNLPWEVDTADMFKLFEKFGVLGRVILPPTHAVALVEFMEPSEARAAFRALAYSRFKTVPLFLEWAPMASLRPLEKSDNNAVAVKVIKERPEFSKNDPEDLVITSTTLYIKNLNFVTTTDTLKTVFSAMGPIRSVKIATKRKGDVELSLGFGFVEFERRESVNRALDELQRIVVDGHSLILKVSTISATTNAPKGAEKRHHYNNEILDGDDDPSLTKLLVRNIPFEASEREVRELFKSFTQLKRLRLPRRYDGRHRGFGFIEFLTHQEARNAKQILAHTHLYGRHLVLEWARADAEDVEEKVAELRTKAAKAIDIIQTRKVKDIRNADNDYYDKMDIEGEEESDEGEM